MIRLRLAVGALAVAIIAGVAVAVAVTSGSGAEPPATGAAAVVPGDALAYVHFSTDPARTAVRAALALGRRLPTYPRLAAGAVARLTAIASGGASGITFRRDIRPWLGNEAALALLNTPNSTAGSELVLDVARAGAARAFVRKAGAAPGGEYRGTSVYRYRSGASLAFVSHYLVLGQASSVRAAIDAAAGRLPSLQTNQDYENAAAGEPADRVIDAYASAAGVRRLLAVQGGVVGAVGTLLDEPALTGATVSVSAASDGARIRVRSAFTPQLAVGGPTSAFTPTLDRVLPRGSLLLLDVTRLPRIAPRVLAASADAGIVGQVGPLLRRLGGALAAEGVDVGKLESLFAGETAVAIGPKRSLIIVTRTANEQAVRTELANLEVPLMRLFPAPTSGSGQVPQLSDLAIDGITAHQLAITSGLQVDYAVFSGMLVVSTSVQGIAEIARNARSLADERAYQATLAGRPDQVTSLLFLDFSQLLNLFEQTGLERGARFRALRPDIERIRAAGLESTGGESDSTAELTLKIP